jgi:hypothetical protein
MATNPLREFLDDVEPTISLAWDAEAQQLSAENAAAFTANEEERHFAADIVTRVTLLSHAYDRLCELGIDWLEIWRGITQEQPHPHAVNLSIVDKSLLRRKTLCEREIHLVMSFLYYEIKSVMDMMKQWGVLVTTGELRYLTKVRDRFLAHPQQGGVMRFANASMSFPEDGGPAQVAIASLSQWNPISQRHYLAQLNLSDSPARNASQRSANESILLSATRNRKLKPNEIVRLKAFGIREPKLTAALEELANLLRTRIATRIKDIHATACRDFGFVYWRPRHL